ncbi:uncharacterized protein LOC111694383 [Trichogramma pretiosum]|uniref:uncharacterized protein LOC111694383 n=1 Tax=Trichogramma pretiosum TaxID=7493 RepID=UPI000C719BC3|nr:uncharacterized protein LOC111694383 [Trichogramma pretiosum]
MKITFIWPYQEKKLKYIGRLLFLINAYVLLQASVIYFIRRRKTLDLEDMTEALFQFIALICTFLAYIFSISQEKNIMTIFIIFFAEYDRTKDSNQQIITLEIMQKGYQIGTVLGCVIFSAYFGVGFIKKKFKHTGRILYLINAFVALQATVTYLIRRRKTLGFEDLIETLFQFIVLSCTYSVYLIWILQEKKIWNLYMNFFAEYAHLRDINKKMMTITTVALKNLIDKTQHLNIAASKFEAQTGGSDATRIYETR